jgi:PAS domain S-box-containing protein
MKRDATGKFVSTWDEETKQRVSLSLTKTAWQLLDQKAKRQGVSRSELIEQFARSEPPTDPAAALPQPALPDLQVAALQRRTRQLDGLLESITDAFVAFDRGWHYTYINQAAAKILQKSPSELLGKHIWNDMFPQEVGGLAYRQLHRAVAEQQPLTWEEFWQHSQCWLEVRAYPSEDGITVFFQDITERKRMEQALRDSEARMRGLFDANPIGIIIGTTQGQILEVNDAWLSIVGYSREDVLSGQVNFLEITPPEYHFLDQQAVEQMRATGSHKPFEKEYIRKDGSRVPILVGTSYLGGPEEMGIGFLVDLSDRKRLEQELHQQEQQFKMVVENAPDIISRIDRDFRHLYVSPSIEQATGLKPEQFIGKTNADLGMPEALYRYWFEILGQVFETGQEQTIEFSFPTPEGDRWYQSRIFPEFAPDGSVKTALNIARDVTDYKRAAAAQIEACQQVEQLLAELRQKERQQQFLIDLNDALRALQEATEILWHIVSAAGHYFNVSRCTYGDLDPKQQYITIERDYCQGVPSIAGRYLLNLFGADLVTQLKQGKTLAIEDIGSDPRISRKGATAFQALQTEALLAVPLVKAGRLVALLALHHSTPRPWLAEEIALMERIAEKTWLAVERARAEKALRDSKARLQLALIVGRMGTWDWEIPTNEVSWSDGHYAILGLQPSECAPSYETWARGVHPDDLADVEAALRQAMEEKVEYACEYRTLWPDGSIYWTEARGQFTYSAQGKPTRMIGVVIDITERKRAEQEREQLLERERVARAQAETANRIKDEFLAVLSHELRSPLNPILGWTRMLRQKQIGSDRAEHALESIERNAKLQVQLIEDLLDVSRILQGKMTLTVTPVNLVATVEAALETVHLAAAAKDMKLHCHAYSSTADFPVELWREYPEAAAAFTVAGDPNRLQQVVWNLLSNAVKFTPAKGRIEVTVGIVEGQVAGAGSGEQGEGRRGKGKRPTELALIHTHQSLNPAPHTPSSPGYIELTVSDTGQGIHRDFLPYVFDYFRQEDSTTTRKFGGLGLGLAIVRHLVELHGGSVWVDSPGPNQGSTFGVRLPLKAATPEPTDEAELTPKALDLGGARVLVVDDEPDMRDLAAYVLTAAGATVTTAASAAQALKLVRHTVPDLLVCDIGMPDVNGYELMQQIRQSTPAQGSTVPAIALTAYAGENNQQQALAAGFQKHIAKPVEPEALVRAIAALLKPPATRTG